MEDTHVTTPGLALDIDETLCATNVYWVQNLSEKFGNPEDLSVEDVVSTYRYTQHVPFWQSPRALAWMDEARHSNEHQTELPLIENAHHVVERIQEIIPIAAYITARPEAVRDGTIEWLRKHGFPEAPLIMRPKGEQDGNAWKARVLMELYPLVRGIIDDNPGLVEALSSDYPGTIFLYDNVEAPESGLCVVPVKTWDAVLPAVQSAFS